MKDLEAKARKPDRPDFLFRSTHVTANGPVITVEPLHPEPKPKAISEANYYEKVYTSANADGELTTRVAVFGPYSVNRHMKRAMLPLVKRMMKKKHHA